MNGRTATTNTGELFEGRNGFSCSGYCGEKLGNEEFPFRAEESPQHSGEAIFAEGHRSVEGGRVCFGMWSIFGNGIGVRDNSNTNTPTLARPRCCYTNDGRLDGHVVLTGSWNFQVKEIEVFEIAE
jgi:hypothetical protein